VAVRMDEPRPAGPTGPMALTREGLAQEVLTPGRLFWRRFRRNRLAVAGALILLILSLISLGAPWIAPHDRDATNPYLREAPPSREHLLGTDKLGRDVLSRLIWGGRVSMTVGLVAVSISLSVGIILGSIAGYFGGVVDNVIMRLVDIVMSFPYLLLLIVVASILKPSIYNTMMVIGFLSWTGVARLVRGEFLSLRQRDFVEAARAAGAPPARLIFRHILPNAFAPIVVAGTLGVASAILAEAGLSFLGLGVRPPIPSWGNMLTDAQSLRILTLKWWLWIPPGVMIFLAVISINLVGDGLRDALDPRLMRRG